MSWNEIADGQPGLALPAMQNWRHSGRFNTDFVPLSTDGTTNTTGLLNMGTAAAPWANAYVATGGAVYIGGNEIESGGGGSAVEVFEQQGHLEKQGINYPLSNPQSLNESFIDDSAMVVTLGKTHLLTETTIYLDRDATSISAIDEASATAWTPVSTGTTATNTTAGQSVGGTAVKYNVTGTDTTYYMAMSFTSFSMTDQDLKVWLYPDTVANITSAMIRLYSDATTTAFAQWDILAASITAGTLNSLYLDVDSPDTSGADYTRSSVNYVALGHIGSATPQEVNLSWDKLRRVDNRALKLPVQIMCDNNTNQEFINIVSTTIAGDVYLLDTITTYSHTISSTEIKLKQLNIAGGQATINTSSSGEAALTGWDISRKYFDTVTTGDLILTSRWWDENYQVSTVTNASTTVLSITTSTVKDGYKSGDVLRLYNWEYIDQDYQSLYNASIGSNFLDLTLTADGTATSSQLTLVHANTSNQNLGGNDSSKWRGVRVSIDDFYRVEAASASGALTKATSDRFIIKSANYDIFKDDFNRSDGGIGNNWTYVNDYTSSANVSFGISSNQARFWINNSTSMSRIYRNKEQYSLGGGLSIRGNFTTAAINFSVIAGISICSKNSSYYTSSTSNFTPTTNHGITISFRYRSDGSTPNDILLYNGASQIASESFTFAASTKYSYEVIATTTNVKIKLWKDSEAEPTTYNIDQNASYLSTGNYFMLLGLLKSAGVTANYYDDLIIKNIGEGFIQKSTIAVSGSKLTHGLRATRKDATNQNPIAYQKNSVIA